MIKMSVKKEKEALATAEKLIKKGVDAIAVVCFSMGFVRTVQSETDGVGE